MLESTAKEEAVEDPKLEAIAAGILDALERQAFADWYASNGQFDDYIRGEENAPSKDEILADIKRLFALKRVVKHLEVVTAPL